MLAVKVPEGRIELTPYQSHVYKALLEQSKPVSWRAIAEAIKWNSPSSVRTAIEQLCRFGLVRRIPNPARTAEPEAVCFWLYQARQ
jgi:predicted transcriptional regulator